MWERNSRFYIPAVHGAYDSDFRKFVERIEDEAVWGPLPLPINDRELVGPTPPVPSPRQDSYAWGVGEEADYIGFLPIFHPIGTDWVIKNEVSGYLGADTPRRASLITHSRLSRRLLLAMDAENLAGRHMGSEMFPVTTALHHGLKAITAPHPIYSDKNLPPESADKWFNSGVNGRTGSTKNSPFSWGRESRFKDLSWYYRANLPGRLYWNFLGWRKEGTGGKLVRLRVSCNQAVVLIAMHSMRPYVDGSVYHQYFFILSRMFDRTRIAHTISLISSWDMLPFSDTSSFCRLVCRFLHRLRRVLLFRIRVAVCRPNQWSLESVITYLICIYFSFVVWIEIILGDAWYIDILVSHHWVRAHPSGVVLFASKPRTVRRPVAVRSRILVVLVFIRPGCVESWEKIV
jgi:hypothetical protein